jgi:TolB-like protein
MNRPMEYSPLTHHSPQGLAAPSVVAAVLSRLPLALLMLVAIGCSGQARPVASPPDPPATVAAPPPLPREVVVSVLPFDDRTKLPELSWIKKGLPDLLVAELARLPNVTVVQRDRLEEVIREQALQLSGRVDETSAVQVGRLTGATVLVSGSAAVAGKTLRMDVQMVGVERGAVLDTASAEGEISDPLAVAKSLTAAVLARLNDAPGRRVGEPTVPKGFAEAVGANANGETLARAGKLFQALEEYEKALGVHPGYVPARSNYSAAVRALSSRDLTKDFQTEAVRDRRRVTARLVDRLATSGLTAEIGRATTQAQDDGLWVLSVPVTLSVDPAGLEATSEMVIRMGGTVERRTAPAPRLLLGFTQAPAVGREVTRQLAIPRRAFVRLLSADGRTIAVSSVLREWQLNRWVAPSDEIHLFVETGHRVEVTARVGGLTEEQVSRIARAEVTVEPVPQERAIVRVEYEEEAQPAGARETLIYRPGSKSESTVPREAATEDKRPKPGELLQKVISELWNPPITILGLGSRVLPGNVRAVVIGLTIEENGEVVIPPRLVKGSGESLYDDIALDTVTSAIPQWVDARNTVGPVAGAPRFIDRPGRVRIHFQLVKDAPSVNVIGPLATTLPVSADAPPLSSREPSESPR